MHTFAISSFLLIAVPLFAAAQGDTGSAPSSDMGQAPAANSAQAPASDQAPASAPQVQLPAAAPLVTKYYCKSGFGCAYCFGSQCPGGQTYDTLSACQSSAECSAASAPKWYCAPCQSDASKNCCWICREYGCPENIGSTFTNMMDCVSSSQCRSSYAAYLGDPVQARRK